MITIFKKSLLFLTSTLLTLCFSLCCFCCSIVESSVYLRNKQSSSWLNDITVEDIVQVKIVQGGNGVEPGTLKNGLSTKDFEEIKRVFDECYSAKMKRRGNNAIAPGGSSEVICFVLKDGSVKTLAFINKIFRAGENAYYEMLSIPTLAENEKTLKYYGFVSYSDFCAVYENDTLIGELLIKDLEFTIIENYEIPENGLGITIVNTGFGTLEFISPDVFIINKNTYGNLTVCKLIDTTIYELIQ